MKELKNKKISVRMTETMMKMINGWTGQDFSKKLENLLEHCLNEVPKLNQEVARLTRERDQLLKDIEKLEEVKYQVNVILGAVSLIQNNLDKPLEENHREEDIELGD